MTYNVIYELLNIKFIGFLVKVAFDEGVDGVRLKGSSRLVWIDVIERISKERKVRILNVRCFCVIRYMFLNQTKMICQNFGLDFLVYLSIYFFILLLGKCVFICKYKISNINIGTCRQT